MSKGDLWISLIQVCAPILIALIGIIPTVIGSRKKTEESLKETQEQTQASIETMKKQVTDGIRETKQEVADLQAGFNAHVAESEDHRAKQARYRILRFYDEVCEGRKHSESHFEDILDDIDFYEAYCATHKEFKNNRGYAAMEYIKEVYAKVKAKGGFLIHPDD